MRVYTVYKDGQAGWICDNLDDIDWKAETEGLDIGEEIHIVVGEMSQEQFGALEEFQGY